MQSTLRRAAAALAVAAAMSTTSQATEFVGDPVFLTPIFGAGLTQYFPFFSSFDEGVAGDTFVDTYVFGTAPAYSELKASIFSTFDFDGNPEISFSSLILADAPPDAPVAPEPFATSTGPTFIRGTNMSLAAGSYYIQVSGTLLASQASYVGTLTDTATDTPVPLPAIPEPSTAWLMALGLGGLAVAARKQPRKG